MLISDRHDSRWYVVRQPQAIKQRALMAVYALLGATSEAGQSLLGVLHQTLRAKVNVFVPSKSELQKLKPEETSSSRVNVFEGELSDTETLVECVVGTRAIILIAAEVENRPGCHAAQDQAKAVLEALIRVKAQGRELPRRLVVLGSADTDPVLSKLIPWPIRPILFMAKSQIHQDAMNAEEYLQDECEGWMPITMVKPGGLSHDLPSGHTLSLRRRQAWVTYVDVAAAMLEVAHCADRRWDDRTVSVVSERKARANWSSVRGLWKGLVVHFCPRLHEILY